MPEPELKSSDGEGDTESPDEPVSTESSGDDDVDMVQTDIGETGADPDGFFDGVDADPSGGGNDAEGIFDGTDDGDDGDDGGSSSGSMSSNLASDINAGVARAAVIGLDDEWEADGETQQKTDLQTEFEETFEAFRLGHYASICAEEYLLADAEDIHPAWGLIGASLICAAVIVYRRPDGDQLVDTAKMKLGSTDLSSLKDAVSEDG